MMLSDHIVFWIRNNALPELKPDQYVWTGKNGKIGQVRNRRSVTSDDMAKFMSLVVKHLEAVMFEPCPISEIFFKDGRLAK